MNSPYFLIQLQQDVLSPFVRFSKAGNVPEIKKEIESLGQETLPNLLYISNLFKNNDLET